MPNVPAAVPTSRAATPRPPAMSDVAVVAGVSHQTVSRVLNDHPSVRPETRARVLAAIAELGYRRNSAARALVTRRTGVLGVVAPASTLFGPTSTLVGLQESARLVGAVVAVAMLRSFDADSMHQAVEQFLTQGVEGLAVIAPNTEVMQVLEQAPTSLPVVIVSSGDLGTEAEHLHQVAVDQRGGGRLATSHLLAQGYGEVVHVAGPQDWFDAQERLAGWRDACRSAGIEPGTPIEPPAPMESGWSAAHGAAVGRRLVKEGLPRAVFAANDQLAIGLLHAFWEAGVRVPDDVAVAGFDDEAGAAYTIPALTTVRQDLAALGARAVRVLMGATAGSPPTVGIIPAHLVVRASSLRRP